MVCDRSPAVIECAAATAWRSDWPIERIVSSITVAITAMQASARVIESPDSMRLSVRAASNVARAAASVSGISVCSGLMKALWASGQSSSSTVVICLLLLAT